MTFKTRLRVGSIYSRKEVNEAMGRNPRDRWNFVSKSGDGNYLFEVESVDGSSVIVEELTNLHYAIIQINDVDVEEKIKENSNYGDYFERHLRSKKNK